MERYDRRLASPDSADRVAASEPGAAGVDSPGVDESRADNEAAEARARFRDHGLATLVPDAQVAPLLLPHEQVVAVHPGALLDRREPAPGARLTGGLAGTLYVTSRRLMLVGRPTLSFGLDSIEEVLPSGGRLLLVLRDGRSLIVEVERPGLLRVELAAARAAQARRAPGSAQPPAR